MILNFDYRNLWRINKNRELVWLLRSGYFFPLRFPFFILFILFIRCYSCYSCTRYCNMRTHVLDSLRSRQRECFWGDELQRAIGSQLNVIEYNFEEHHVNPIWNCCKSAFFAALLLLLYDSEARARANYALRTRMPRLNNFTYNVIRSRHIASMELNCVRL